MLLLHSIFLRYWTAFCLVKFFLPGCMFVEVPTLDWLMDNCYVPLGEFTLMYSLGLIGFVCFGVLLLKLVVKIEGASM